MTSTDKKLIESEERHRLISENSDDLIRILDEDLKIKYINEPTHLRLLGYSKEDLIGKSINEFTHPEEKEQITQFVNEVIKKGESRREGRLKHKKGHWIWFDIRAKVFQDSRGNWNSLVISRDISEKKLMEIRLKESEKRYRLITENANDLIGVLNKDFILEFVNEQSCLSVLGYKSDEVVGKSILDFVHPSDKERGLNSLVRAIKKKEGNIEIRARHKNGSYLWFEVKGKVFIDDDNEPKGILICRDITNRKQFEKRFKESEERFKNLYKGGPVPAYTWQKVGDSFELVDYNNASYTITQGAVENYLGIKASEMYRDRPYIINDLKTCFDEKINIEREMRYYFKNLQQEKDLLVKYCFVPSDLVLVHTEDITERKAAEKKLKESEEKYRLITENVNDLISILNENMEYEYINDAAYQNIMGRTKKDLIGNNSLCWVHPDDLNKCIDTFKEGWKKGEAKIQARFRDTREKYHWFEIKGKVIIDHKGEKKVLTVSRDISETKETNKRLKESEEKYRALFENMNAGFAYHEVIVDENNKPIDYLYHEVNPAFEKLTGLKKENLIGKRVTEAIPGTEHDPADWIGKFGNVGLTGIPLTVEEYSEAIEKWFRVSGYSPKKGYFAVTFTDITDIKKAERKIIESEERYRLISEASNTVVWTTDMNLNLTYVSSNSPNILGYTAEEAMTVPFSLRLTSESLKQMGRIFEEEVRIERKKNKDLNRSRTFEINQIHKNGSIIPSEITFTFIRNEEGKAIGILGVTRDISEQKKAEKQLKDSELKFKDLYEEAPNAYFSIATDKSIIRCNKAAERLLGYTREELMKLKVFDLYTDNEYGLERAKNVFEQFIKGESINDVELQMKTKNGGIRWVSLSVKPIIDEEGRVIESRSMILDINERKLAQEELKNSYDKLKDLEYIINNSPSIVFLWKNAEGWPVEYVSKNVKQFGYTPEEFYSGKVIYSEIIYPDDLERVANEVQQYSNELANEFVQEYRILTKSGELRWIDDRTWIRRDLRGNITHFQGIILDITDRKKADEALKLSEHNYREAYDRASFYKDLFAHDINNILQVINSSAELISLQLGDSEKSKDIKGVSQIIKKQVRRGAKLISNVRTLTELEERKIPTYPTDLSNMLINSIDFVKRAFDERTLKINMTSKEINFTVDANDLLQDVFENILINSVKYNENSVNECEIIISKEQINNSDYIKIQFIDNGIGVHDDRKKIIFQSGNRELKGSKGMGFGLSLVSKILESYGGKIWVEDRVKGDYSQGSNFIVLLPQSG